MDIFLDSGFDSNCSEQFNESDNDDDGEDEDEAYNKRVEHMFHSYLMSKGKLDRSIEMSQNGLSLNLATKFYCHGRIPKALFEMQNIEVLDLRCNNIEQIPDDISRLTKLKILDLSQNKLTALPRTSGLEQLKEFYCSDNKLQNITDFLENAKMLEILYCSNNPLNTIDPTVKKLPLLSKLVCRGIGLLQTPECFTACQALEWLDISCNPNLRKINYLPPNLQRLFFFGCYEIVSFNPLEGYKHIIEIDGSKDEFKQFPISLCYSDALVVCNLRNNKLRKLPQEVGQLKSLKVLLLSGNLLTVLPDGLCELEKLKKLDIADNRLKQLPQCFYKLKSLVYLNWKRNMWECPPIEVLKRGVSNTFEYFLELQRSASIKVLEQKVILLGDSEAGKTSLTNALKDGSSALTGPEEKTVVLEVHKWQSEPGITFNLYDFGGHEMYQITHPLFLNEKAIHLLVFDATHFLVKDIEEPFQNKIIPWLETLQDIVPRAIVFLVGTHIDLILQENYEFIKMKVISMTKTWIQDKHEKTCKQLNRLEDLMKQDPESRKKKNDPLTTLTTPQLMKRKKDLSKVKKSKLKWDSTVHMISSAQDLTNVEDLQEKIIDSCKSNNLFLLSVKVLPESWNYLSDNILAENEFDILPIDKVYEIADRECNMGKSGCETTLRYLHDVGRILWFRYVKAIVFHKVSVLIELLQALFRHDAAQFLDEKNPVFKDISRNFFQDMRKHFLNFGDIANELLGCLWGHLKFGKDTIPKLCELLQNFDLCFRFKDEHPTSWKSDVIHVPWLLAESAPTSGSWPKKVENGEIQLQIEFDFDGAIPNGFYEKSSVIMHKFTTKSVSKWKHGFMAKVNKDKVHLKRDQLKGAVILATRSKKVESAWKTVYPIFEKLKELLNDWPGKQLEIYEICPHCIIEEKENPAKFPYEMLEVPPPKWLEVIGCPTDDVDMEIEYLYLHPDAVEKFDSPRKHEEKKKDIFNGRGQPVIPRQDELSEYRVSSEKGYFSNYFKVATEAKQIARNLPDLEATSDDSQQPCTLSDAQLSQLARNLPHPAWQQFAIEILQVPNSYITRVEAEKPSNIWAQQLQVLRYWRQKEGSRATLEYFKQLLLEAAEIGICINVDCIQPICY